MTGVASFGGAAGYIGKVADDELGARFTQEFRAAGVAFDTPARPAPPGTARSLIAVTADGQRSMNTYLGASTLLSSADIDAELISAGAVLSWRGICLTAKRQKPPLCMPPRSREALTGGFR
jgi:sugar/nucleoside kinase (ribokinase family)